MYYQGRYIVTAKPENSKKLKDILKIKNVEYKKIGSIKNYSSILHFPDKSSIYMEQLEKDSEKWINEVR